MPNRYARPEVQISLSNGAGANPGALKLTISFEEAQRIEKEAEPIRQAARKMLEDYQRNRGTDDRLVSEAGCLIGFHVSSTTKLRFNTTTNCTTAVKTIDRIAR
jgi:hypothetical protein